MTEKTPTLGDIFSRLPFSVDEEKRIAALVMDGGTPGHIVSTYVTRTHTYKNVFLKKERIAGFRAGSALYNEHAIRKIGSILSDSTHKRYKFCWGMYRESATAFIRKELAKLDRLLVAVRASEDASDAEQLIKAVCISAPEFGVSADDIRTFYDVWGVSRIEQFETLMPTWLVGTKSIIPKRQAIRTQNETAELRRLVDELASALRTEQQARTQDREQLAALREQNRMVDWQGQALAQRVSQLETTQAQEEFFKRVDDRVASLAEKVNYFSKTKPPVEGVSRTDLQALSNQTELGIAAATVEISETLAKTTRDAFAVLTSEWSNKIEALYAELARARQAPASMGTQRGEYRSPLVGVSREPHAPYRLTAELDFVNTWLHYLSQVYDIVFTFEQAVAYHRAFLGSPVVVCDRILALSWIRCLSWQPFTMHMAASPTWSSEEDWAQGAEHLFRRDSGRPAQFLMLHNYDVGLPDCYLAPTLTLWALRRESTALSKLFLLPSRHDHVPSANVLEHALYFGSNDHLTTLPLALRKGVRTPAPAHRDPPVGAEPKIVAQWASCDARIAYDLVNIQRALKCRMAGDLVASFERTVTFISKYIEDASAIAIAMHHQVIPWVQLTYGEAKATELSNLVKTMAGSTD